MAPLFPLVVIVHADEELRLRRLVEQRGMSDDDARARIAAQADDEQRRAVADVWLDNSGSRGIWSSVPATCGTTGYCRSRTTSASGRSPAHRLGWHRPIRPGRTRRGASSTGCKPPAATGHCASTTSGRPPCRTSTPRTSSTSRSPSNHWMWPMNSPNRCCRPVTRASSTSPRTPPRPNARSSVPGLRPQRRSDVVAQADSRFGRPGPAHQCAHPGGRSAQSAVRPAVRRLAESQSPVCAPAIWTSSAQPKTVGGGDIVRYVTAKEPWFLDAYRRAWEWADTTGWKP